MTALPRIIIERCHYLAQCTDEPGRITRPFASESMRRAMELAGEWMREAGMTVRRDNVGNLRGRYEGEGATTLLLGSHLDSVRDAGKYDGPLGVITAIAAVQRLHDSGARLPYGIEVLAFADEEGLRYGSTYLGSRAVAGPFEWTDLQRVDAAGIRMADAIRAFGGDPDLIVQDRWQGGELLGYVEVHIEQGPVLEARGLPVGVVSAIVGQSRLDVEFLGEAGHAGTVPMERRRDALAAAADFVLTVEAAAATQPGMVATVGKLEVEPGAANVIPGHTRLSFDARHADDRLRSEFVEAMMARAREIARRRKLSFEARITSQNPAVRCAPRLVKLLTQAAKDAGQRPIELTSGAGHDGVVMSSLTDVGMLFVRCKGGVSHNPAESVTTEDVAVALDVLSRFLELLAKT
ncbi:MAG TPA: allantoate amidohydrolase [Candidatus Dormibacteraeota bacterium]|nr:allantoate amidohydrolase [Candidatus Dormibacteraeota bacterium]